MVSCSACFLLCNMDHSYVMFLCGTKYSLFFYDSVIFGFVCTRWICKCFPNCVCFLNLCIYLHRIVLSVMLRSSTVPFISFPPRWPFDWLEHSHFHSWRLTPRGLAIPSSPTLPEVKTDTWVLAKSNLLSHQDCPAYAPSSRSSGLCF